MSNSSRKTEAMHAKQNSEIRVRAEIIEKALIELSKAKVKPENRTAISRVLAEKLTEVEGKPCSNTTILRSKVYSSLIDKFMSENGYFVTQEKREIQNNLLSAQLEIRELRKENIQLNRLLEKSLSDLALFEHDARNVSTRSVPVDDTAERFCRVIQMLLEKLSANIDKELRVVTDSYDHSVLFDQSLLPEYFEQMNKHSNN
ncbi:MAG: hypothetical protein R3271_12335 [Methylophaga sp.]|uniref:hypothetical protein n=1 Tax=Methylophaga sp. TaxID=2024840 RepID=UPI00299E2C18|nr:hypothetical protein [Methylophaga sp.]MDX1751098.1 hypothetical protein [Methylophaga sp.]